MLAEA